MQALHLFKEGDYTVLNIEVKKGKWVTIIKEFSDSPFSHIIEPLGIQRAIETAFSPTPKQEGEDNYWVNK